jgi:peptidoglycan/LPS O-acetylase OafA/YrhL
MAYRRDIDGLRAVAVLAVVLFHAKVPGFSGGFVGVDVFFVISGYLITGLIFSDIVAGRFSFLGFYYRRIKRIVPALVVVYLASAVLATVLMLPGDIRTFASTLIASTLFVSNIALWQQGGYFDAPAELQPLLHTWSLSIEEQFYLVWPALCVLIAASRLRWLSRLAWIAAAVSLVAWIGMISFERGSAAFFLAPFRIWELMLGAGLALMLPARRPVAPLRAEIMAAAGALMVVGAVCAPLQSHALESFLALPACIGAVLLIFSGSGGQTAAARLLSTSPMVGIGLISYSLYLWHWPLLSFARYYFDRPLQWDEVASLLALSLVAAIVTYRLVEQPVRRMTAFRPQRVVATGLLCLAAFAVASYRMERDRGWALNLDPAIRQLDATARSQSTHQQRCFAEGAFASDEACTFGHARRSGSFDLAMFGDSHAHHYAPAISLLAKAAGLSGRQFTIPACPALLGSFEVHSPYGTRAICLSLREAMVRFVEQNPRLRLVVLAQSWSTYTGKEIIAQEGRKIMHLVASRGDERSERRSSEILRRSLEETLDFFAAKDIPVLLLGEVPPLGRDPVRCMAGAIKQNRPHNTCGRDIAEVSRIVGETNALLAELARTRRNVFFFSPSDAMCEQGWCHAVIDGIFMYRDATHLNRLGAERLAQAMRLPPRFVPGDNSP